MIVVNTIHFTSKVYNRSYAKIKNLTIFWIAWNQYQTATIYNQHF
jgi:hypothetical protein